MAIIKKPARPVQSPQTEDTESAAAKFISGAPDAPSSTSAQQTGPRKKRVLRGVNKKIQICFLVTQETMGKIDELREETGLSISTICNMAISEYLNSRGRDKTQEN